MTQAKHRTLNMFAFCEDDEPPTFFHILVRTWPAWSTSPASRLWLAVSSAELKTNMKQWPCELSANVNTNRSETAFPIEQTVVFERMLRFFGYPAASYEISDDPVMQDFYPVEIF